MSINHYLPRYEGLAAPTALLGQYDSQPQRHRQLINSRKGPPASGQTAGPPRTSAVDDDTPLYWQTVQAMASRRRRFPGQQPR
jgi:hypothetical protein